MNQESKCNSMQTFACAIGPWVTYVCHYELLLWADEYDLDFPK